MRKAILQAVVVCMVLAVTMGVANAEVWYNNYPNDLIINAANPQPWTYGAGQGGAGVGGWVNIGSGNFVNGPGAWDGTIIVESDGVVTSDRIWVGRGLANASGRLIIDGGMWTGGVLDLAQGGPTAPGGDEVSVVEVKNGGTLDVQALELAGGGFARMIVDNASVINPGASHFGINSGDAEVTFRNGASGGGGFTAMEAGTGSSVLNVTGAGTVYNGHGFHLGGNGRTATINVTGGGSVLADNFYCSKGSSLCDVTISGAGSSVSATHTVDIGQVGQALVTLDEGGVFAHNFLGGSGVHVYNTATLVFGVGNGSKISTTGSAVIDDGATIGVKFDSGFTPTLGVPYDLVTADGGLTVTPANLVLDQSQLPGGWTASLGEGSLQVTFIPEPGSLVLMAVGGLLVACGRRKG